MNSLPVSNDTQYTGSAKKKKVFKHKVPTTGIRIPVEMKEELLDRAEESKVTFTKYVLDILDNFLNSHPKNNA